MVNADVVIVGAGIVGSSIAYHLTEAGCRNVLVIERETRQGLGSPGMRMGACGRSSGQILSAQARLVCGGVDARARRHSQHLPQLLSDDTEGGSYADCMLIV